MLYETIDLYAYFGFPREGKAGGVLTAYCREAYPELGAKSRPAVLVVPGGAYLMCSEREREPVALRFLNEGYAAFTLVYSTGTPYPVPLLEAAMAMVYLRENAEKYAADPQKVAVIGFSAGGHLAGMLAMLYAEAPVREKLGRRAELVRPDAALLCYPVITTGELTHRETAETISGGEEGLRRTLSLETRVTGETPPIFLWHTADDDVVPVENSLLMAQACRRAGVPFELHVYEAGHHGLSLGTAETEGREEDLPAAAQTESWAELALRWLRKHGFRLRCL